MCLKPFFFFFMVCVHLLNFWICTLGPTKKKKLDWDTRLRIALGAAQGLAYLHHDCSPRIIHRDVKSSNILLDQDLEAHLTDFGIAKSLCTSKSYTSTYILGTIGYIDPEYARTSRLTEKSDVYSYGIVLLELLTGRKAVDNESNLHHLVSILSSSLCILLHPAFSFLPLVQNFGYYLLKIDSARLFTLYLPYLCLSCLCYSKTQGFLR